MIPAIIVVALLVLLVVILKLVTKSLYRERKINHSTHSRGHVHAKAAPRIASKTA